MHRVRLGVVPTTGAPGSSFLSVGLVVALGLTLLPHEVSCAADSASSSKSRGTAPASDRARSAVPAGVWGGEHINLEITERGALVEYDCARGEISEPLRLDAEGRFQARGNYVAEHGGPVRDGEAPAGRPASYSGSVRGRTMKLTVTLTEASERIGTFTLAQGSEGDLVKCR